VSKARKLPAAPRLGAVTPDGPRQIIVLPHLDVEGDGFELGASFRLVSSRCANSFVPKRYQRQAESLTRLYRTLDHDIQHVALLLRKRTTNRLDALSALEREQVPKLIDGLAFSIKRSGPYSLARDNFDYTIWSFPRTEQSGDTINIANRRFGFHVIQRRDHMLQVPAYVHFSSLKDSHIDADLFSALARAASGATKDDNRISRAVSWLNQARTNSDSVSDHTRLILMSAAFETLLDVPSQSVTAYFKNAIQLLLGASPELEEWADEFYRRRSKLVHGEALPDLSYGVDRHSSIIYLAEIIFRQCVLKKLILMRYIESSAAMFRLDDVRKFLVSNRQRFREIQKSNLSNIGPALVDKICTVQETDLAVRDDECERTMLALVAMGVAGIARLRRMTRFRAQNYQQQLKQYVDAFRRVGKVIQDDRHGSIRAEFAKIAPDAVDKWADAAIRGTRFGSPDGVRLDQLIYGLDLISAVRSEVAMRS
jgi:hypothetical protein